LEDVSEISVTRKGTVYEVLDYGEAPDDFDTGDEELYFKWCEMQSEDGDIAHFALKTKRSKYPGYLYLEIDGLLDDIAAGYLEIIPGTVNFKEIPHEYFLKIIKALEIRLGELWNQFLISTQFVADLRNRNKWHFFIHDYGKDKEELIKFNTEPNCEKQEKLQNAVRKSNKDLQNYEATLEFYDKILVESIPTVE